MLKASQIAHEARGLLRGCDVQRAGELHRLVGDDAEVEPSTRA